LSSAICVCCVIICPGNKMKKDGSGKNLKAIYHYTLVHKGKEAAQSLLKDLSFFAGQPYDEASLIDEHTWYEGPVGTEIYERAEKLFNDDEIVCKIQVEEIQEKNLGILEAMLVFFLPSPAVMYERLNEIMKDFTRVSVFDSKREGKNRFVIESRTPGYFPLNKGWCYAIKGALIGMPTVLGYDPAVVEETECSVPLERKGVINGKFYRVNENKEVLEYRQGDDEKSVEGKVIGRLAADGAFKLGGITYGALNCVYHVSWQDKSWWARTFGRFFNREALLRKAVDQLKAEKALLEQKYEEIDRLNSELEEKVRERTRQLEQSNKLKDLFISIMDHDIKNSLTSVLGYCEILKKDVVGNDRGYVEIINREAVKINELISEARVFSRLQDQDLKKTFQRLDLGRIVEPLIAGLRAKAERRGVVLAADIPAGRFFFNGLPLADDIFLNLIDNAVKYADEKSTIDVYAEDRPGKFVFCVRDRGKGVPDEYKLLVFNRFERIGSNVKDGVEGSGLGLAIVKALVASHKGRVWIEDNPAGGAIFKVELEKVGNE
jgi:signal transduction histidine kinase